jgi:hypothetical protein
LYQILVLTITFSRTYLGTIGAYQWTKAERSPKWQKRVGRSNCLPPRNAFGRWPGPNDRVTRGVSGGWQVTRPLGPGDPTWSWCSTFWRFQGNGNEILGIIQFDKSFYVKTHLWSNLPCS